MKTNKPASIALKLSALAGAAGIAPAAHANIVQSPTLPLTPPSSANTSTLWDIDGSSHNGFKLRHFVNTTYVAASIASFVNATLVVNAFSNKGLINLNRGFIVGPTLANGNKFSKGSVQFLTLKGFATAQFPKGTPGYFGFKFISGGINDYGWGTLLVTGTPKGQGFTIQNAYYDNTGASIKVGQTTAVPEPSSVALLALGATGLATWRLRRKTAEKAA